jgi:hypothetical protein
MTMIDPLDKCILLEKARGEFFDPPLSKDAFRAWALANGVRIIRSRPSYVRPRECLDALARHDSSSIKNGEPGSSGMAPGASELVAALNAKLRVNSRNTLPTRTSQKASRRRSSAPSYSPISTIDRKSG